MLAWFQKLTPKKLTPKNRLEMPLLRRLRLLLPAALLAVVLIGAPPASALTVIDDVVTINENDVDEMFDISFFMSGADIFSTFCEGDCGGLTSTDFDGVTLDTTTWWNIDSITSSGTAGGDTIVFTIKIIDESTGWSGTDKMTAFGFNTDPDIDGSIAGTSGDIDGDDMTTDWTFSFTFGGTNLGGFSIEDCVFAGNNCQGGAGNGLVLGTMDEIELTLTGDFCILGVCELLLEPLYAIKYQTGFAIISCSRSVTDDCFQESIELAGFALIKPPETEEMPEPASLLLFGTGLLGLGVFARRRRRFAA